MKKSREKDKINQDKFQKMIDNYMQELMYIYLHVNYINTMITRTTLAQQFLKHHKENIDDKKNPKRQ